MKFQRFLLVALVGVTAHFAALAGNDVGPGPGPGAYTGFTNMGSIGNTRHNMTQSTLADSGAGGGAAMNGRRNNYFEVCVYCHTPHGSNTAAAAPLWNRALSTSTVYTTYNELKTSSLTGTVGQPGAASLPCLSCHDGQQATDAIINMPGSGKYKENPTDADLTAWQPIGQPGRSTAHYKLNADVNSATSCLSCHSPGKDPNAVDLSIVAIGTDLRNDHPIGVTFPSVNGPGTDWKTPGGTVVRGGVTTRYFDETGGTGMDKGDIRVYGSSGTESTVECASCHDPHGVPSAGVGTVFNPTFLRKSNTGSMVCLTCHTK